jgi:hypothetical protein
MNSTYQAPLTPEQLAAINAGGGFAKCEDPVTHVQYQLIQLQSSSVDDDYIRAMLAEAQASIDRGEVAVWDVEEIKREARERLAHRQLRD